MFKKILIRDTKGNALYLQALEGERSQDLELKNNKNLNNSNSRNKYIHI